jgi:MFS family permease
VFVAGSTPSNGLRSILTNRRFSLWLGSQFTSNLGYSAWSISVLWLAYQISGTLLLSALVLFIQYGIYSITFIAGPLVDRISDKRTVFLIVLPLQALTATLVGIALAVGSLSVILLLGAVVVMALLDDFWWTAGNTVPRILVGKDNLLRANGLQSALVGGGSLTGYAAGAVLLVLVGPEGGAFLRAAMLAGSTILILVVSIPSPSTAERGLFHNLVEGWSILGRGKGRPLLQIGALFAAEGFFLGAPALLITLFANRDFGGSSSVYGLFFTTYMVGAIASGLAVGRANPRRYLGPLLVGATIAEGAAIALAVASLPQLVPSAGTWFVVGLTGGVPSTLLYSYLQATSPPDAVGRVVSDLELFPAAASAFGAIALGLLAIATPPAVLGYWMGVGLVAAGIAAVAVPAVRGMQF